MSAPAAPALSMRGIVKAFPGVRALDGVSFDARAGEVHAICGENGAGKSTLIKILGGVYRPDGGALELAGRPVAFAHPVEARRAGVSIIHQELSLLPYRTVAENIFLGSEPVRRGVLGRKAMRRDAEALIARVGARVSPDDAVERLSIADRQLVEVAKALAFDARVVVMDEPTAALDDRDALRLLDLVGTLRREGVAVVYISHRMPEVMAIADRATVLKDGRLVGTLDRAELSVGRVVHMMVGRDLADYYPPRPEEAPGAVVLSVKGGGNDRLRDIDLELRAGEIVGVAGLEGSGKSDLAQALFGDHPLTRGEMRIGAVEGRPATPRAAIAAGLGYLPSDRKGEGLAPRQSVRDNAALTLRAMAGAFRRPGAGDLADLKQDERLRAMDVRAADYGQEIGQLSGGNQQKAIIARWLAENPKVLVFAEPTRGIDVAAKAAIYAAMRETARRGHGILVVSSDLPEVIGVSDRILVMAEGRIAGALPAGAAEAEVMALAIGHEPAALYSEAGR
jgi:ribose transport system ATP-binding protein